MFKRILYEDWQMSIPVVAFGITFAGFLFFTVRGLIMKRSDREHMAFLPLEDEPNHLDD
jgi:hypothetical protein